MFGANGVIRARLRLALAALSGVAAGAVLPHLACLILPVLMAFGFIPA